MVNAHLNYDRTKPLGKMTAELVTQISEARANVNRIQAVLVELGALGGGTNGAVVEGDALFGVEAGKGNAFVTAIGWLKDGLNGANTLAQDKLADLDLGG